MNKLLLLNFILGLFTAASAQQGIIQPPATGQTASYYPGDDGDLQLGIPIPANRFTDHGNGTLTDDYSGLMWSSDANLIATRDPDFDQDRTVGDGDINWITALNYIQKLNDEKYLGHNDWRMPNCLELRSLLNLGNDSITFPEGHPFTNLKEGYWSSTTSDRLRGGAIAVYLSKYIVHANTTYPAGHWETLFKDLGPTISYFVLYLLPVRNGGTIGEVEIPKSGQRVSYYNGDDVSIGMGNAWPSPRLVDNKDGSVSDRLTGLMWTKDTDLMYSRDPEFDTCDGSNGLVYWETALGYIHKLNTENYLGYTDWRLPNRNELTSLIDFSRHYPCLPERNPFFTPWLYEDAGGYPYWSSTTLAINPEEAWVYHFGLSNLYSQDKNIERFVWPVRTDNSNLPTGTIHGVIDGDDIPKRGIEMTMQGPVNARTETDIDGYYEFTHLPDGNYTVTPSYEYFAFTPQQKSVNVSGTTVSCDFMAVYTRAYGWKIISSRLFPLENASGAGLSYIYFINDDEGWIASTQDIYHTTDGGQNFEPQTLPLDGDYSTAIFMFNENEGYAGSASGWIYHTDNGGDEWTLVNSIGRWVLDISFPPGSTTGYASGAEGSFWEISPTGLEQIATGSNLDLRISTPSVGHTFIGASPHRLWHYDGNEIVDCCTMGGGSGGIHFLNDTKGWLSKGFGGIDGSGGIGTYNCIGLKPSHDTIQYHFTDVHSPNGKDVWVVGAPGTIYYSPNGDDFLIDPPNFENNVTWKQQAKGLSNDYLQTVFFTSLTNGYASGSNGALLKYTLLEGAPEGADILGIQIPGQIGNALINKESRTVIAEVTNPVDLTKVIPEIFISAGATLDPPSGTKQDFTNPVVYKVTASDATTKNWTVTIVGVDGIEEDAMHGSELNFKIYPNPAHDKMQITCSDFKTESGKIELLSLDGKKLLVQKIKKGFENIEIDVSNMAIGMYLCKLSIGKRTSTKKIIIE